jgi:tetratricopeptide (TPR) repeat protein
MPETALTSLKPQVQKQVDIARLAVERENYEYAIKICLDVLQKHPECLAVRKLLRAAQKKRFGTKNRLMAKTIGGISSAPFMIAASTQVKKNPGKAMDSAEKMLSKDPSNATALKLLADAAKSHELPATRVFALEGIREIQPDNIKILLEIGDAYIAAGRPEAALNAAERVLELKPGHEEAQALIKSASVAQSMQKGKWEEEGSYRDKLRDESQAISLEQEGKVVAAEDATRSLIEETLEKVKAEPENLNHYRTLIKHYQSVEEFEEAIRWVNEARKIPAGASDSNLEKLQSELKIAALERDLAAKTREFKENPENQDLKAEIDSLSGELDSLKLEEAKALVEKYPNDYGNRFEYGRLLFNKGEVDAAIEQFQVSQRNAKVRVQSLIFLGNCFKQKKQYDLAVQQYATVKSEISGMNDQKKEVIYELAGCYEKMDKTDEAIAEYKSIYSVDIGYRDVAEKINKFYSGGE